MAVVLCPSKLNCITRSNISYSNKSEGYTETMIDPDKFSAINKRIAYHLRELSEWLKQRDSLIRNYTGGKMDTKIEIDKVMYGAKQRQKHCNDLQGVIESGDWTGVQDRLTDIKLEVGLLTISTLCNIQVEEIRSGLNP